MTDLVATGAHLRLLGFGTVPSGKCLNEVWNAYGSHNSIGPHAGHYQYALEGWEFSTEQHPGDRNVPTDATVYFTAGANGFGHVAISAGGNVIASTDIPSAGRTGLTTLEAIEARWGRRYLGYTTDFLGYQLVGLGAVAPPTPTPAPAPVGGGNPFGISDVRGLQKIAHMYGGNTGPDNVWGPQSAAGFSQFLRKNWSYSGNDALGPVMWAAIARWLRARWGYVGNDVPGPIMRAHLENASMQNFATL